MAEIVIKIIKLPEVIEITGLSKTSIYRYIKDPESPFPKPFYVGANRVRWHLSSIEHYILSRGW